MLSDGHTVTAYPFSSTSAAGIMMYFLPSTSRVSIRKL